jgi:hypothetical protein
LLIPKLHDLHMSKLHARNKTIMYYGLWNCRLQICF